MSELELKAFFDCSKELREAALAMSPEDVRVHTEEILASAQINELVEGEKLKLEVDINGVAHIPIQGMLTNHVTPSAGFFGESITTFEFLSEAISQANEIDAIKELAFEISSGGGEVDGLEAVANAIFNTTKPTTARIHGMAASAAFWLASQTDRIIATGRTSSAGSIGVAAEFIDRSAQDKNNGVKRVILTSTDAPQKRLDITTAAGQKQTINRLDEIHTVFVDHIVRGISARNPEINNEFVNKNFGKGSVMAADAALKVGMIDEIEGISMTSQSQDPITVSIDIKDNATETINEITSSLQKLQNISTEQLKNEENMTLAEFLAQNQTARNELHDMLTKAKTEGVTELKAELKATSERVLPIVKSGEYVERVIEAGFEAMAGERSLTSFLDFVSLSDQISEKSKSTDIKTDQPDPTPGDPAQDKETLAVGQTQANAKALSDDINTSNKVT